MRRFLLAFLSVTLCLNPARHGLAAFCLDAPPETLFSLRPLFTGREPILDGLLNDEAWNRPADVNDDFIAYSPRNGDRLPEKTKVWLAYDSKNFYFAFYCYDSRPEQIKTALTKRDNMWGDDWIGFNIDTIGNKRYGYVFVSNPNGVQGDLYDSSATGADAAPDYVWYSAGKIVPDGYIVEIRIPLASIKYSSGTDVRMNIIFERKVTRLGLMASWPRVPPGKGFFAGMSPTVYAKLEAPPKSEWIPVMTYGQIRDRLSPAQWSSQDRTSSIGISGRLAMASSIDAEATINPDFSQVETDAFQILVNQRYPAFFSEKRPFFMEIEKIFSLAGNSLPDANLVRAVHTRRIVDPAWGLKANGELQRLSLGLLMAADEWPGRTFDTTSGEPLPNPFKGERALISIGRIKWGLGGDSYAGILAVDRLFAGGENLVLGADLYARLGSGNHFLRGNLLHSFTKDPGANDTSGGSSATISYEYRSKPFDATASYEYFGRDFQMDLAFIRKTGIQKISADLTLKLFPRSGLDSWLKRISPFLQVNRLHDLETQADDSVLKGGLRLHFPRNGSLQLEAETFREGWYGYNFEGSRFRSQGGMQLVSWLGVSFKFGYGEGIYYDPGTPEMGHQLMFDVQLTIQPNKHLTQFLQYSYDTMKRELGGESPYSVNILNSSTTFQVNRQIFLRAIVQYDSYLRAVLSDALASYELTPGAVIFFGYGSLHEKRYWDETERSWSHWGPWMKFYRVRQSLFIKTSFRIRF